MDRYKYMGIWNYLGYLKKIFSMNEIWDNYIEKENLHGFESNIEFLHLTDNEIYEKLLQKG